MMHRAQTIEEKAVLAAYIASKIGTSPQALIGQTPFEVASITRHGRPMGAVLYANYRKHSVEMTVAGEPGWISRGSIQAAFHFPFIQLGVWNVLAMVNRNNAASRELSRRIGFTELCVIETGGHRGEDIILYGMTRDKCLWISDEAPIIGTVPEKVNGHEAVMVN